jgi:hypothetical protein
VEFEVYPHAVPPKQVSEYVSEAAERAWLAPQRNWQNASDPGSETHITYIDPWRPGLAQWPLGYKKGTSGTTKYFARCWRFNPDVAGRGFWEKLSPPIAPDGFNLFLVVSGVTWWFAEENRCSTSLVARAEGIINDASHERFLMQRAGKLLADVKAWLEGF